MASHFASTTFCWLPPDRKRASCSSDRARSSTRAAESWTETVVRQPLAAPPRERRPAACCRGRTGRARGPRLAVLGDEADPGADPGARAAADGACRRPRPCRGDAVRAEQRARQLGAPEPCRPGEADDLAGADLESTSLSSRWRRAAAASGTSPRPRASRAAGSIRRARGPTISEMSCPVCPRYRRVATCSPSLSTVMRSQIAKISRRRWEM